MDLLARIEEQQRLAATIKELQAKEKELRSDILEECFGYDMIGTVKTQVSNLVITGEYGLTYIFDQNEIDQAIQKGLLSEDALNGIRVKYELDKKVYNVMTPEAAEELNEYLTIKPSLPTLKIKAVEE